MLGEKNVPGFIRINTMLLESWDCVGIVWGRLVVETLFIGMDKNPKLVWGPSPRTPTHPHAICLRGDAWGNAWGGYAWVSETGVLR